MAEVLDVAMRWRERRAEVRSLCRHRVHLECHELAQVLGADDEGYLVQDLRGQLDDRRSERHPDTWAVRAWRALLRARLREQRGRACLCADGTWPALPESHAWDHTPCPAALTWGRDAWGRRVAVSCEAHRG